MQSINKNLSGLNFSAARTSIQLMRDRDLVEEYTKKSFIVGDPDYVDKLREFKEGFASSLQDMQYLGRSEREQVEINRLVQFWEECRHRRQGGVDLLERGRHRTGGELPCLLLHRPIDFGAAPSPDRRDPRS